VPLEIADEPQLEQPTAVADQAAAELSVAPDSAIAARCIVCRRPELGAIVGRAPLCRDCYPLVIGAQGGGA
jgi:hypothetical protein